MANWSLDDTQKSNKASFQMDLETIEIAQKMDNQEPIWISMGIEPFAVGSPAQDTKESQPALESPSPTGLAAA
jgi:hypothetical protein